MPRGYRVASICLALPPFVEMPNEFSDAAWISQCRVNLVLPPFVEMPDELSDAA